MKHIQLFESFNSYDLPNFRMHLVQPGMKEGKYLFSLVDGNGNSYWGVFDLGGLKKLEEDMNTMCIIEELKMEICFKRGADYGPIDWARPHTKMVINKVPHDVRYLNLVEGLPGDFYRAGEGFFPEETVKRAANQSDTKVSSSGELKSINKLWFGMSVEASVEKPEITGRAEPGDIQETYPAETNTLWVADHHWSNIYSVKKGESDNYFINKNNTYPEQWEDNYPPLGYRPKDPSLTVNLQTNPWVPITIKDVEHYIPSIIDAGATKGFLKILNRMRDMQGEEKQW